MANRRLDVGTYFAVVSHLILSLPAKANAGGKEDHQHGRHDIRGVVTLRFAGVAVVVYVRKLIRLLGGDRAESFSCIDVGRAAHLISYIRRMSSFGLFILNRLQHVVRLTLRSVTQR